MTLLRTLDESLNLEIICEVSALIKYDNYLKSAYSSRADAFPILRKLPDFLSPWRKEGRRMHAESVILPITDDPN